jgi:hypothetical protein
LCNWRPTPLPSRTAKSRHQPQLGVNGLDVAHSGLRGLAIRPRRDLHVPLVVPLQSCRLAGGRRLSEPEVPTKLAHLSVIRTRLAIAHSECVLGVIGRGLVDASLVGSGIGDADTGIVGVCLCWWNAEGCQCYGCCRRHAHYCPLHLSSSFPDPLMAALLSPLLFRRGRGRTGSPTQSARRRSSNSASAASIDGSGPPRSRAARRRAATIRLGSASALACTSQSLS